MRGDGACFVAAQMGRTFVSLLPVCRLTHAWGCRVGGYEAGDRSVSDSLYARKRTCLIIMDHSRLLDPESRSDPKVGY